MRILVLNVGSTSLKFGVFDGYESPQIAGGELSWPDANRQKTRAHAWTNSGEQRESLLCLPDDRQCLRYVFEECLSGYGGKDSLSAIAHRVVHGGTKFRHSLRIDASVKAAIGLLGSLAPLHNPPALRAIEAAEHLLPGIPQIAVFDTSFYSDLPARAYLYAIPYEYYERWGIRRFGFHGLSHAYCSERAAELLRRPTAELRLICCHLGGGCSATAVRAGRPVAMTTGFSPLDGLPMGTRPGSIDPGILLHLQREHSVTLNELDEVLNRNSGLQGISGISGDLREIERAIGKGNPQAKLAFEVFTESLVGNIGNLAARMGGVDSLVFTDRIGENSPTLRQAVCERLRFLGFELDTERNAGATPDALISCHGSAKSLLVIHTREELMAAREAQRVLGSPAA